MITNIDDSLQVVRDMPPLEPKGTKPGDPKGKQALTLIYREGHLADLLYQFVGAGYPPGVTFESSRITALKLELNKMFVIKSHERVVVVDNEEVCNNVS